MVVVNKKNKHREMLAEIGEAFLRKRFKESKAYQSELLADKNTVIFTADTKKLRALAKDISIELRHGISYEDVKGACNQTIADDVKVMIQ